MSYSKVRIVCDGSITGTTITDERGEQMKGVVGLRLEHTPGSPPFAYITILAAVEQADMVAVGRTVQAALQ